MSAKLEDVRQFLNTMPKESYDDVLSFMQEWVESHPAEDIKLPIACIHCGSIHVVRNGKHNGKQAYICRDCGKKFLQTSSSMIEYSHSSEAVWKQVIQDTVEGVPIDKTAGELGLSHGTVFNMRPKILVCVENEVLNDDSQLVGVNEADETYVLESMKGTKLPDDYYRNPRKHGSKATKRGISDEYICVCTSVGDGNKCIATAGNRSTPSKEELNQVFGDRVGEDTIIRSDGNTNYDVLKDKCTVAHSDRINKVNGFHSFIKRRITAARGVATKYLNRYAALFAEIYGKPGDIVDKIYSLMTDRNDSYLTNEEVKDNRLLLI